MVRNNVTFERISEDHNVWDKPMVETCKSCGAEDGVRIFRHKDGKQWTRDWSIVCSNNDYSPTATMIYIKVMSGLCSKCAEHAKA